MGKLSVKAFSCACAIIWAGAVLICGIANIIWAGYAQAFLEVVSSIYPGYEAPRRWLRTEGPALHRYRFD